MIQWQPYSNYFGIGHRGTTQHTNNFTAFNRCRLQLVRTKVRKIVDASLNAENTQSTILIIITLIGQALLQCEIIN